MNLREVLPFRKKAQRRVHGVCGLMLCSLAFVFAGCGGGQTEYIETEEGNVKLALSDVAGAASDPTDFRELFVEGAAPEAERDKYRPYMYRAKSVKIDGANATAMVEVEDGSTGQIVGEIEWTLVLQGEEWKLKTAPLP
jgi:hypothetical protein